MVVSNLLRKFRTENKDIENIRSQFLHESIDYKESTLRLIRVHPKLSPQRSIQCSITHATISDKYTCLSYVWGASDVKHKIEINGKGFLVQSNLFKFLQVARKQYPDVLFWIDALSIDQENDQERNHQVQQMGNIYSRAKRVLVWMGYDASLTEFLQEVADWSQRGAGGYYYSRGQFIEFGRHPHWSRAWITQETLLAQKLEFVAPGVTVHFETLVNVFPSHYYDTHELHLVHQRYLGKGNIKGRDLMYLLYMFRAKHCAIPRDKVYSLLSLCGYGAELEVDYRISDRSLFHRIFQCCPINMCLCTLSLVAATLLPSGDEPASYVGQDIVEARIERQDLSETDILNRKVTCKSCTVTFKLPTFLEMNRNFHCFCVMPLCPNNWVHVLWATDIASESGTNTEGKQTDAFVPYDTWIRPFNSNEYQHCILNIRMGEVYTVRLGLHGMATLLDQKNLRVCTRIEKKTASKDHNPAARIKIL